MAIPKFEKDVKVISKLPNYPGSEGGLTPAEFREKFDEASEIIKDYLNNVLIPEMDKTVDVQALLNGILDPTLTATDKAAQAKAVGDALNKKLSLTGGTLAGPLVVLEPTEANQPATKGFVESKHFPANVTLLASGWSAEAPYTLTVEVAGILATDQPHYGVVYSEDVETALAQKEAFAMVDDLDTADGSVTFTCFEDRPEVDIPIQMEVNR